MSEGQGSRLAQTALSPREKQRELGRPLHLISAGILFVVFFWPAFFWAGEQLEGGDEPWQLVLVPFLAGMIVSQRYSQLRAEQVKASPILGIPLMVVGAAMNLFGVVIEHPVPSQVGMVACLHGVVLFLWGWRVYRGMAFPLLYLFLAVPLPRTVLVAMTGSLKVLGAAVAGKILTFFGFTLVREGAILKFPTFTLVVADECSGMQSVITLGVASLSVAYLMEGRFWKKVGIVLLSVPLALVANVFRLCVTAFLGQRFGEKVTHGTPHTVIGAVIVLMAFFGLYGLSSVVSERAGDGRNREGAAKMNADGWNRR
ncbi:MAG: exosortase/archaeosortase family protein [bacterium]|nr:exosortase/archaeosortase family protein [bacterium]